MQKTTRGIEIFKITLTKHLTINDDL